MVLCPLSAGIMSVLSLTSECTSLGSELPKVSYVKAIDIWMMTCLLFGFASLVEYAVVQVCVAEYMGLLLYMLLIASPTCTIMLLNKTCIIRSDVDNSMYQLCN